MVFDRKFVASFLCFYTFVETRIFCINTDCHFFTFRSRNQSQGRAKCFIEATRRENQLVLIWENGTCGVCGQVIEGRVKACHPSSSDVVCAKFEEVPLEFNIFLLFRTNAHSGVLPYELFMYGPANRSFLTVGDLNRTNVWYKSPLFDVSHLLMSALDLELGSPANKPSIKLTFSFFGGRITDEGAWFSPGHLYNAYPWSLEKMKTDKFDYFSLRGRENGKSQRRFFISIHHSLCTFDTGYMAIVWTPHEDCEWDTNNKFRPSYLWLPNDAYFWKTGRKEETEFRIYGTLSKDFDGKIFVRV